MVKTELSKETSLFVDDLETAKHFYTEVMGFTAVHHIPGQSAQLQSEDSTLTLFQTSIHTEEEDGRLSSQKPGQLSFGIQASDVSKWRQRLKTHGTAIEDESKWPNGAFSLLFRDPAGNKITLATQLGVHQEEGEDQKKQPVNQHGLNARWKLFYAVNASGQGDRT